VRGHRAEPLDLGLEPLELDEPLGVEGVEREGLELARGAVDGDDRDVGVDLESRGQVVVETGRGTGNDARTAVLNRVGRGRSPALETLPRGD